LSKKLDDFFLIWQITHILELILLECNFLVHNLLHLGQLFKRVLLLPRVVQLAVDACEVVLLPTQRLKVFSSVLTLQLPRLFCSQAG